MVSILVPGSLSQLVAFVFVFVSALYSGGLTPIPLLKKSLIGMMRYISFMTPAVETFYVVEVNYHVQLAESLGVNMKNYMRTKYDYQLTATGQPPEGLLLSIFCFGLAFRVIACIFMIVKDQQKKV